MWLLLFVEVFLVYHYVYMYVCACVIGSVAAALHPPHPCHWLDRLGFQDWTDLFASFQTDQGSAAAAAVVTVSVPIEPVGFQSAPPAHPETSAAF